jgi:hypothetical protein
MMSQAYHVPFTAKVRVPIRYITEHGLRGPAHRPEDMAVKRLSMVLLVLLLVGACSFLVSSVQASSKPVVKVQQGLLQGKLLTSARSKNKFIGFLGIPYAKPPVGDLKFKVMQIW